MPFVKLAVRSRVLSWLEPARPMTAVETSAMDAVPTGVHVEPSGD
jgi:hypothetical protein